MAKNRNRNKQVPQNIQQPKTNQPVKLSLTEEQKLEIEAKQEDVKG